jgi:hypothetical protein
MRLQHLMYALFPSPRCLRTWGRHEDGNCRAFCHSRRPGCECGCHGMDDDE